MARTLLALFAVALAAPQFGCTLDLGGGGGGGGTVDFREGYAFIRKDDRKVYVADRFDFSQVARLSTAGNARHPSLSKDGRQVVFVRAFAGDTELLTVPTTGDIAPTRLLASSATQKNLRTPVFSPDGTRIVFAFDDGVTSFLGVVNTDGSGFATVAGSATLSYAAPSFYADGSAVLAVAGSPVTGYTQLEKVVLATGAPTNVANNLGDAQAVVNRAVLSPDGTRAAFDGRTSTAANRIFVVDLATRLVTQLTDYPSDPSANDSFPCWLGNTQVTFSSDSGGNDAVYALQASAQMTSGGLQMASAIEPWYGPNP